MKHNDGFTRVNHRSIDKGYKEFAVYAIARNINKYHRFKAGTLKEFINYEMN